MAGKVGVVRELAIAGERDGKGYGFVVGDRYTHSIVFRSEDEARAARKKVLDALNAAVEVTERWAPERR